MNLDFYNLDVLEKELEKLPPLHRIAFAASICERMLPNYYAFAREEGEGNPSILRTSLDEVWQILQGKAVEVEIIKLLIRNCQEAIVPGDYVLESRYSAESHLAVVAISSTLKACLDSDNIEAIIKVVKVVGDTIFGFLDIEKEITEQDWLQKSWKVQVEEISKHPFTLREIAKEKEDIQRLKEVETLDREFLESLRTSFNNGGRSLIDLS
ncbi:DUF416 family protein [Kamptonema animale CS-326]|jgi:uncharacterized protein YjaG (DUF416 family)|uniref:DUF416 family protein n=1 Tax=Kamptonema animale TaxID=92934 RepID=UPI00232F9FF1|nr:DUF416 family protein [Kamptonema animale]MDB9514035.1 DUF416 family protein [Kamptonema animale CS-326]